MFDAIQDQVSDQRQPVIGRVLRASTAGFSVGCRVSQLSLPSFGCLVKAEPAGGEAIYGLIYDMYVDDDPVVRRLVLAENPSPAAVEDQRNNRLLPVEMKALAVGYCQDGEVVHALPPRPPLNLDPVRLCRDPVEVRRFTDRLGYLRLILRAAGQAPADQLLVAHIRQTAGLRGDGPAWTSLVVGELIELLRNNYDLLAPALEAIGQGLPADDGARLKPGLRPDDGNLPF
jgi:hypothetical protein